MYTESKIWIAMNAQGERLYFEPRMLNRHGLITGATGTGKTVSLKVIAESLSEAGVPVFLADIKGDLASLVNPGEDSENMLKRKARFGLEAAGFDYRAFPVQFWDVYGEAGSPLRTTVSEMGPVMLGRILGLNETQEGVLNIVFRVADDEGLLLLDLKDLRAMLNRVAERAAELRSRYGNVSGATVGAIARALLKLEDAGGDRFFAEPALDVRDFFRVNSEGLGTINVLDAQKLFLNPLMYSTFLLWLLSELYEVLPEVGDPEKPRLVFFFDEAHLLFNGMSADLLQKITQVVKLIRSKGVGIFFISQSPTDIPSEILSQLGNKLQHALRAYTPADQCALRAAAMSFRSNPDFDTEKVLSEMATGEALLSPLQADGSPAVVQRVSVLPPQSAFGSIEAGHRAQIIALSDLQLKYGTSYDRESAYEVLEAGRIAAEDEAAAEQRRMAELKEQAAFEKAEQARIREEQRRSMATKRESERLYKEEERRRREQEKLIREQERRQQNSLPNRLVRSTVNSLVSSLGRSLARGILGSFKR